MVSTLPLEASGWEESCPPPPLPKARAGARWPSHPRRRRRRPARSNHSARHVAVALEFDAVFIEVQDGESAAAAAAAAAPVFCAACGAALGSVQLPLHRAAELLRRAASGAGVVASASGAAAERLPAKLAKASDPYLTLLKDALWLTSGVGGGGVGEQGDDGDVAETAGDKIARVGDDDDDGDWAWTDRPDNRNAFRAYTAVTRVAEALYALVQAHGQYTFLLAGGGADAAESPPVAPAALPPARLHLTISSWNSCVAWGREGVAPRPLRAACRAPSSPRWACPYSSWPR